MNKLPNHFQKALNSALYVLITSTLLLEPFVMPPCVVADFQTEVSITTRAAALPIPVLLDQMISSSNQSLTAYAGLMKKLVSFATKIGKKPAGSSDRKKLVTQANTAVSSFITKEGKIYKAFKKIDAQKGNSGILQIASSYYLTLHKDLIKIKGVAGKKFTLLITATVRRANKESNVIPRDVSVPSLVESDQCLNGAIVQYENQLKQMTEVALNTKDPFALVAAQASIDQVRRSLDQLKDMREKLQNTASNAVVNNFIEKGNAEIGTFNAAVVNYNNVNKDHPIFTHGH